MADEKPKRHRWVKLRIHVYICRQCGTGRVNSQQGNQWITTWHRPDGTSVVASRVPACEEGPLTGSYIGKYQQQIDGGEVTGDV